MIIGITGFIGSGKDTIADYLTTYHGFKRISFAASLKDAIANIFGWERELLEGTTKTSREWREQKDVWWSDRLNMEITPRWVLQYWGTEVCRKAFHEDIWVASLEHKLLSSKDDVVITDCRFINEVNAIKNAGGITMRVSRGEKPIWYDLAESVNTGRDPSAQRFLGKYNVHASEYSSVGIKYDYYVDNNGTIDDLHNNIQSIINSQSQDHLVSMSLLSS
jgi:hypothetical protein